MTGITLGLIITPGHCGQLDSISARTPIEWIVPDFNGHSAALISRYARRPGHITMNGSEFYSSPFHRVKA